MILYIYSASLYPGGSQANSSSPGFDWVNNYWCNLLNPLAMNGQINPARPVAIVANVILAITMAFFFYSFPQKIPTGPYWKVITPYSGSISMLFACLLFTPYHDRVSLLSGFFGVVALSGIFYGLIKVKSKTPIIIGLGCIVLIVLNNLIYFSGYGLVTLPVIQKITLAVIFAWVLLVHRRAYT